MDETIHTTKENIEALKAKLAAARAELRTKKLNILKSRVNTAKAKVGTFVKKRIENIKNTIGLLPLSIESRLINIAKKWEIKRTARIIKRTERRKIIISKIDTAKAKVGRFNKKIVNGVKNTIGKIKEFFTPNPEKRASMIEELKRQKAALEALREHNKDLAESGSYRNIRGSRGMASYIALFVLSLFACCILTITILLSMIK